MKLLFSFVFILTHFIVPAQQTQVKQIQFLLKDLRGNFKESIGVRILHGYQDSSFSSTMTLEGTTDNHIDIAPNEINWASYTAYINDSCTLKEAKILAEHWRNVVRLAAPDFKETKKDGSHKNFAGHQFLGYDFALSDKQYKYWVSITYSKLPTKKGYSLFLMIGKQIEI
jgi:hypothetical protein